MTERESYREKINKDICPTDLWNLDETFAQFIVPRLEAFKEHNIGLWYVKENDPVIIKLYGKEGLKYAKDGLGATVCPNKLIDEMIYGFTNDPTSLAGTEADRQASRARAEQGRRLFAKHFDNLWI